MIKQAILELLQELKSFGKDRRTIETDLSYSSNYIDQVLSKGGNERFYAALQRYREMLIDVRERRYDAGGDVKMQAQEPAVEYGGGFWKQIPEYRSCDYATKATGNAMQPLIRHNAIVGGKRLDDPAFIVFGEVYIIQARNGMEVVRYIQPAGDPADVLLTGARKGAPATEMRRADIAQVFHAQFVVNPL